MARTVDQPEFEFEWIPTTDLLPLDLEPEEWFFRWVDEIEPNLPEACIVYDYPAWQAALARRRHNVAERFEVYIHGVELANAFDEEGNSAEIRQRWTHSNQIRQQMGTTPYPIDEQFLQANQKMPRCSGIALGIDRLFMLLTKQQSIHDLLV
jgi:lysyl-tRNA synthetase class 2